MLSREALQQAESDLAVELDQHTDAGVVALVRSDPERRFPVIVRSMWILSNANQLLCDVPQYVIVATDTTAKIRCG